VQGEIIYYCRRCGKAHFVHMQEEKLELIHYGQILKHPCECDECLAEKSEGGKHHGQ